MGVMETFMAYANEFEQTYADDEWQRLEKYFADDAVYEVQSEAYGCRLEGPAAIFAGIKKSLDGFDRRMDTRKIEVLAPPTIEGDSLEIPWAVSYTLGDAPPIRVEASSKGTVENGRITYLADTYALDEEKKLLAWVEQHGPDLTLAYV